MSDKDIQEAFAQLLETVAMRMASAAAARTRGDISEEQFAELVLATAQSIAPGAELPLRSGEFSSPARDAAQEPEDFEPPWDTATYDAAPAPEAMPEILTWVTEQASRKGNAAPAAQGPSPSPVPEPAAPEPPARADPADAPHDAPLAEAGEASPPLIEPALPEIGDPAPMPDGPPLDEAPLWELEDALADTRSRAPAPAADIFSPAPGEEPAPVRLQTTGDAPLFAEDEDEPSPAGQLETAEDTTVEDIWAPRTKLEDVEARLAPPPLEDVPQAESRPGSESPEAASLEEPQATPETEDAEPEPLLVDQEWEPGEDPFAGLPLPPGEHSWAAGPAPAFEPPPAPVKTPEVEPEAIPTTDKGEREAPVLVDQEWEPEDGDPFEGLPQPSPEPARPERDAAPMETAAEPAPEEPLLLAPEWSREPQTPAAPEPKPTARPSRPQAHASRVIVSGSAQWERDDSHELEDTMFRLGVDEDVAERALAPRCELKSKDRDFIARETRRALEGGGKTKSPVAAFLLSLFLPGAGSAYAGRASGVLFAVPALALGVFLALKQITPVQALMGFVPLSVISACLAGQQAADENRRIRQRNQEIPRQGQRETTLRFPS